ncbi:hypothetical protein DC522_31210 [Microvirga sp. KLBC 81]|nr:hypothetical protein DC522_31210 [Microvirga sp. KLBC 81]
MAAKSNAKAAISWTWAELVDAFLAEKLPELTEPWRSQYEGFLRHEGLTSLSEKHVCDLRKGDLEEVRDAMLDPKRDKRIARSTVWRLIKASKEMLSWAWGHHARKSGLENTEYPWWQSWTVKYKPGKRDHTPTLEELVRTIIIAEHHRTLSEKEHATSPGTLAALWATILLGQRLGALLLMRESRLFEAEHLPPGWKVMNWSEDEMKSAVGVRLPHSLPIPPAFFEAIQPYRDEIADKQEETSDWLFPSGKGGDHVTKSAMNRLLYRLEGKEFQQKDRSLPDRKGKPGPKPRGSARSKRENLLAKYDVRAWTPHDVRRTLTSFLDDCRLGGAASAILAHRENRKDEETAKERTLPVTRIHYSRAQRLDLKAEGMTVWIEAILRTYQVEKKKLAPAFLASRQAA